MYLMVVGFGCYVGERWNGERLEQIWMVLVGSKDRLAGEDGQVSVLRVGLVKRFEKGFSGCPLPMEVANK